MKQAVRVARQELSVPDGWEEVGVYFFPGAEYAGSIFRDFPILRSEFFVESAFHDMLPDSIRYRHPHNEVCAFPVLLHEQLSRDHLYFRGRRNHGVRNLQLGVNVQTCPDSVDCGYVFFVELLGI